MTRDLLINGIPHKATYTITPGRPGMHTLPNGDPGYPDDPDEIEVHEVITWDEDGNEIDVTDSRADEVIEMINN